MLRTLNNKKATAWAGKRHRLLKKGRAKSASIQYRGKTFPGYNQPIASDRPNKKKMVLAKKGDRVKLIHFGQKGYKHNYSDKAKANYLKRSAGIRGKGGKLTKDDKFSANYWARRVLWPSGPTEKTAESAADIRAGIDGHIKRLGLTGAQAEDLRKAEMARAGRMADLEARFAAVKRAPGLRNRSMSRPATRRSPPNMSATRQIRRPRVSRVKKIRDAVINYARRASRRMLARV